MAGVLSFVSVGAIGEEPDPYSRGDIEGAVGMAVRARHAPCGSDGHFEGAPFFAKRRIVFIKVHGMSAAVNIKIKTREGIL
mgnify:CR=1 FL=1|jgi:hypothetical protein